MYSFCIIYLIFSVDTELTFSGTLFTIENPCVSLVWTILAQFIYMYIIRNNMVFGFLYCLTTDCFLWYNTVFWSFIYFSTWKGFLFHLFDDIGLWKNVNLLCRVWLIYRLVYQLRWEYVHVSKLKLYTFISFFSLFIFNRYIVLLYVTKKMS